MSFNFSAMILAAGLGKRMLPLTKDLPKPLIQVNGITLLENSINFLTKLGCNQIIINTHYKYKKIKEAISQNIYSNNITVIHEKKILGTGGGVINAIPYCKNNNLLIINSDIFWQNSNLKDARLLINKFKINLLSCLLLVDKKNAFGLSKKKGDFIIDKNKVSRFKNEDKIIYYSGLQMINLDILNKFSKGNFSFNIIWDSLINKKILFGQLMESNWYHVGDIPGLKVARKLSS